MNSEIIEVVLKHGSIPIGTDIAPDADLFALGMSSYGAVQIMLALEEQFDVRFPDELLKKEYFSSIDRLVHAVQQAQMLTPGDRAASCATGV